MTYDFNHYKTQDALWKRIQFSLRKKKCVLVFHDNKKSSKHTRWLLNRTLLEVKRLSKETESIVNINRYMKVPGAGLEPARS